MIVALGAMLRGDASRASTEETLKSDLCAFIEVALTDQDGRPVPVIKRREPIRIAFDGDPAEGDRQFILGHLDHVVGRSGLKVETSPGDANLFARLRYAGEGVTVRGRTWSCYHRRLRTGTRNELLSGEIVIIMTRTRELLDNCIPHELMHALGFPGHPHHHESVLSYHYCPVK
ncbi:MAG: hypothetical protein FJX52_09515 [Alphaproteobacteria bacterium]|nr:hypothetical protein [Alphaproteobacteria bacterium]